VVQTISYPSETGVKDLCTVGINPLRCVVCQVNKKKENKMTCGDADCVSRFFRDRVIPDTSEERTLR
jgi:hypothetical protein